IHWRSPPGTTSRAGSNLWLEHVSYRNAPFCLRTASVRSRTAPCRACQRETQLELRLQAPTSDCGSVDHGGSTPRTTTRPADQNSPARSITVRAYTGDSWLRPMPLSLSGPENPRTDPAWSPKSKNVRHTRGLPHGDTVRERDLPAHVAAYYVIALALYMRSSYREVLRCLREGVQW